MAVGSDQLCLHCRSPRVATVLRYRDQTTFKCRNCLGYFNQPSADAQSVYSEAYFETVYGPRATEQLRQSRGYIDLLRRYGAAQSLLDYGCGTGMLLLAAQEAGLSPLVGADVSEAGLARASANLDPSVQLVDLTSDALPARKFDAITLVDSISALSGMPAALERLCNDHLAEDGLLAIRTPSIPPSYVAVVRCLALFIGAKQASRFLFAENRYALFDSQALERLLARLGFMPVHMEIVADYPAPQTKVDRLADRALAALRRVLRRPILFMIAQRRSSDIQALDGRALVDRLDDARPRGGRTR